MQIYETIQNLKHMTSTVAPTFIDQEDMALRLIDLEEIRAESDPIGELMFSMVLYFWRNEVNGNHYLMVPDHLGGYQLNLEENSVEKMVSGLGLKKDIDISSLVGQRLTCIFRAKRPDKREIPVLKSAALTSKYHRDLLDFTADDMTGPLRQDMFLGETPLKIPDLSSIREHVWF